MWGAGIRLPGRSPPHSGWLTARPLAGCILPVTAGRLPRTKLTVGASGEEEGHGTVGTARGAACVRGGSAGWPRTLHSVYYS